MRNPTHHPGSLANDETPPVFDGRNQSALTLRFRTAKSLIYIFAGNGVYSTLSAGTRTILIGRLWFVRQGCVPKALEQLEHLWIVLLQFLARERKEIVATEERLGALSEVFLCIRHRVRPLVRE